MGCLSSKAAAGDPQREIEFLDKYELADVLGTGAYGSVHLAYSLESREHVAVKTMKLNGRKKHPTQLRKDVSAEERVWAHIGRHPNIVCLRESFIGLRFAYFVMELCPVSLFTAFEAEAELNEFTYARYFKEIAQALAHIHSVGVVHRDVKQDNFVVGAPDGRTVKLCDFGLSAVITGNGKLSGQVGTAAYMALEVTRTASHGPPADMWSFGVIIYTAFFGCWPHQPSRHTAREMKNVIRKGKVTPTFEPPRKFLQNVVSQAGIRFVKALLNRNPPARPSAVSCLEAAYLIDMCCNANYRSKKRISLSPQLWAAVKCGAFSVRPKADAHDEWRRMSMQSTAELRHEPSLLRHSQTSWSKTDTSDAVGANAFPSERRLSDIRCLESQIRPAR